MGTPKKSTSLFNSMFAAGQHDPVPFFLLVAGILWSFMAARNGESLLSPGNSLFGAGQYDPVLFFLLVAGILWSLAAKNGESLLSPGNSSDFNNESREVAHQEIPLSAASSSYQCEAGINELATDFLDVEVEKKKSCSQERGPSVRVAPLEPYQLKARASKRRATNSSSKEIRSQKPSEPEVGRVLIYLKNERRRCVHCFKDGSEHCDVQKKQFGQHNMKHHSRWHEKCEACPNVFPDPASKSLHKKANHGR